MLFWSAPSMTETVHSTTAPVVPRTPIEAPSAAIRKPGFASAMTNPSHHVIALRSCLSSTSAFAMPPLPLWPRPPGRSRTNWYRLVGSIYHALRIRRVRLLVPKHPEQHGFRGTQIAPPFDRRRLDQDGLAPAKDRATGREDDLHQAARHGDELGALVRHVRRAALSW